MRAVIQRVKDSNVKVKKKIIGQICCGLLMFLGIGHNDSDEDIDYLVDKIINLNQTR